MSHLTTRTNKFTRLGMLLVLGATLFLSGPVGAADYPEPQTPTNDYKCDEYKQVYAQTDYNAYAHQHLDVVCDEGYRAISCEAEIQGENDYNYNWYFVALNEAHPETFKKNSQGAYEHTSSDPTYYGCHFRANNVLQYFTTSSQPQYPYDFEWALKGYATCVPKECVYVEQTPNYYEEYEYPENY